MNTSKQINVMIGVLFLTIALFGAYVLNEGSRQDEASEEMTEKVAERGARLFVANCRSCHGLVGEGPAEGAIAPALNNNAFLILGEHNEFGAEPTPTGEANGIRDFLFDTISCGRAGTFMPVWSQKFSGPLSETQVNQIVTLITEGRWDLVEEEGALHDEETGATAEDILVADAGGLSITGGNCGQYNAIEALEFRSRDPFAAPPSDGGEGEGEGDGGEGGEGDGGAPMVKGLPVADFFQASCASCHGADRAGLPGLGLPLTPSALTQPDDFYFDTIKNGRPGTVMPAWGAQGLTDEDISTLVTFITTVEP